MYLFRKNLNLANLQIHGYLTPNTDDNLWMVGEIEGFQVVNGVTFENSLINLKLPYNGTANITVDFFLSGTIDVPGYFDDLEVEITIYRKK